MLIITGEKTGVNRQMHDKMSTSLLTVYPDISTVEEIDHAVLEEMLALEYIVAGKCVKYWCIIPRLLRGVLLLSPRCLLRGEKRLLLKGI